MTDNQQRIIDGLIAEFNSRNEKQSKRPFKLINVDEFDAVRQRHLELTDDALRTKDLWNDERNRYIDDLINQIREDIGDRLCVERGSDATGNINYLNCIFIYEHSTSTHSLVHEALRMELYLLGERKYDDVTKDYYNYYNGFQIRRYVSGNEQSTYKDEVEFFNCHYTKGKLKELLS